MKKIILSCSLVLLFSCDLIFIENISEENIRAIEPLENTVLEEGEVSFIWEDLEDVDTFNLQIATPNFTGARTVVLDTILGSTSFAVVLENGEYEWRIKGSNDEYETPYTNNSFSIENDIGEEEISILAPIDETALMAGDVIFSWELVEGARAYQLQIASPDFTDEDNIIVDIIETEVTFTQEMMEEGDYEWRVKASNEISETEYKVQSLKIN